MVSRRTRCERSSTDPGVGGRWTFSEYGSEARYPSIGVTIEKPSLRALSELWVHCVKLNHPQISLQYSHFYQNF